jgi:hypothetical protein
MVESIESRKRQAPSAWMAFGLLLCVAYGAGGCTTQSQTHLAQEIPRYPNSNMYCREDNYSPQLIPLLPECKPDPPDSTVFQRATTVWTYNRSASESSSGDAVHK